MLPSFLLFGFLSAQPTYTLPLTVIGPTKRLFAYGPNGDLTEELVVGAGQKTRYVYDALNRLIGVKGVSSEGGGPVSLARYTYDGEGKRVSVTEGLSPQGTVPVALTTTSLYDGLLPVLERQGSTTTTTTTTNTWGLSFGGGIGGLLCRHEPQATGSARFLYPLYPLYDGSGNILAWTDATGAIVSTTSYTAFGEILGSDPGTSRGLTPFGFSTKSYSPTTGLVYFGARFYRPDLARWLTPDPLGQLDGPNVYLYARMTLRPS